MATKFTKGLTVRVEANTFDKYNKLCDSIGVMPSVVLRLLVESCVAQQTIPVNLLPEKVVAKMQEAVKNADRYRQILENK